MVALCPIYSMSFPDALLFSLLDLDFSCPQWSRTAKHQSTHFLPLILVLANQSMAKPT